jgi:hypothetical protein
MPTAINHRFRQYVAVERFELTGRTPDWLSRYDIGKSYDLGNGRRQTLSIVKLCHQIVHSFVFTYSVDSHRFADTLSPAAFVVNHLADKRAMPTLLNLPLRGHVPGTITKVGTR